MGHYRQSNTDRYALQCYSSGLGFAVLGEGMRQEGYLPEKPEATGGRGIGRRRW